jgi:GH18 family chitinase
VVDGANFDEATKADNNGYPRKTLVNNIKDFVIQHEMDGVDINWEYPEGSQWNQCIALLDELKTALSCKRISITLSGGRIPTDYSSPTYPQKIWSIVDAIHLMTYDQSGWATHSVNTQNKNTGGTSLGANARNASFPFPTTLNAGTIYYYCLLSATGGAISVPSNVATVTVVTPPTISGPPIVCTSGVYSLSGLAGNIADDEWF